MDMTRGDIDECASAYVMIDKDGNPTGASPPDPDRAYCMVCRRRIWAYDDNTAFPTELGLDGDWIDVGGGACCREMFAIKRRQTVGEAGQVASINLFHYRRGVWPTSRVFIACGPVASCIPPWMCSTQMFGTTVVDATGRDTRKAARVAPRGLFRVLRAFRNSAPERKLRVVCDLRRRAHSREHAPLRRKARPLGRAGSAPLYRSH